MLQGVVASGQSFRNRAASERKVREFELGRGIEFYGLPKESLCAKRIGLWALEFYHY